MPSPSHSVLHYCRLCGGRGVVRGVYGMVRCPNLTGTAAQRDAVRKLHGVGTQGYQSPFRDNDKRSDS